MARTVRDTQLETRAARERLAARHKPYWRLIDEGCHLGYRKGARGGTWRARYFIGKGRYVEASIGKADDVQDSDGTTIFSFREAQTEARNWFSLQAKHETGLSGIRYTVGEVLDEYLTWYGSHRRSLEQVAYVVEAHIRPILGKVRVVDLTSSMIRDLQECLATMPARVRSKDWSKQRYAPKPVTKEQQRKRRATANRITTILKAALNRAYQDGRIASDDAWRRVHPFRNVDVARVRYLSLDECRQLVVVCDKHFGDIVRGAILTGCRYGELAAMLVGDFNPDSGTILVADSKSGRPRHVVLTEEGVAFIQELIKGKKQQDLIFIREDGKKWGKSHQARPLREACEKAGISEDVSFHILRHTHASHLAMQGTPLAVIAAQLGHSDTRMAEKHYAHLSPNYIAQAVRAGFPKMRLGG